VKSGVGCGIYGAHPASCRAFACEWLTQPAMPPKFRPDRTKVVLTTDGEPGRERLVANCDPATPFAWKREPIYGLLKQQARANWNSPVTVVAKAGLRLWLITPDEDVDLGEADPRSTYAIDRSQPGKVRVTVTPPID
jgi:hypothetical protein